jgi:hypothetical protein
MKKILLLVISLLFSNCIFSQNASTYFPPNTGYKWYYKNIPLDSNNNPMPNLARYRVDTFAVVQNYSGLQASVVRVKDNLLSLNQNTPYTDTNYHNFQGTNGFEYLSVNLIPDTTGLPIGVLNFFKNLQGWYSVYQFASSVGTSYQILTKDTTILINSVSVHLRLKVNAKRLGDETVSTVNGNYNAKKFVVTNSLYVVILILEQPIVTFADTTWISSGVWMVKDMSPFVKMDLSQFGYGNYSIPGQLYELTSPVGIRNTSLEVPDNFKLYQNYPNPFNPVTNIKYQVTQNSFVTLKIFDALGREVATLVNEKLNAGEYESQFPDNKNSNVQLNSGVYFYSLYVDGKKIDTKKMMLLK